MSLFVIIFGTLCAISAGIIIFLYVRAWPRLTLLDVHKLPEVRESQKKNEILRRRVAALQSLKGQSVSVMRARLIDLFSRVQSQFRASVDALERTILSYRKRVFSKPLTDKEIGERMRQIKYLLQEAEAAFAAGAYETAEKSFIAVISLDQKAAAAYRGLGDVYFAERQFTEAKETYRYALHLEKNNEHTLARLGEIAEAEGDLQGAVEYYQQAVLVNDSYSPRFYQLYELLTELGQAETALAAIQEALSLEPQNPKYLDSCIEASILAGNKNFAEESYRSLRMVNPENQKLPAFRERIESMPS